MDWVPAIASSVVYESSAVDLNVTASAETSGEDLESEDYHFTASALGEGWVLRCFAVSVIFAIKGTP
jgi:hypothetical protein